MTPTNFPEATNVFGPPPEYAESQVMRMPAYIGRIKGGSIDGAVQVVVAWLPTPEEIEQMKLGKPIYLSFLGALPPHFPSMSFEMATHPA